MCWVEVRHGISPAHVHAAAGVLRRGALPTVPGAGGGGGILPAGLPQPVRQPTAGLHAPGAAGACASAFVAAASASIRAASGLLQGGRSHELELARSWLVAWRPCFMHAPWWPYWCEITGRSAPSLWQVPQSQPSLITMSFFLPRACCCNPATTTFDGSQTMEDLAAWMMEEDFWHAPAAGWLWWAWNPNSHDTGGIVRASRGHPPAVVASLLGLQWSLRR